MIFHYRQKSGDSDLNFSGNRGQANISLASGLTVEGTLNDDMSTSSTNNEIRQLQQQQQTLSKTARQKVKRIPSGEITSKKEKTRLSRLKNCVLGSIPSYLKKSKGYNDNNKLATTTKRISYAKDKEFVGRFSKNDITTERKRLSLDERKIEALSSERKPSRTARRRNTMLGSSPSDWKGDHNNTEPNNKPFSPSAKPMSGRSMKSDRGTEHISERAYRKASTPTNSAFEDVRRSRPTRHTRRNSMFGSTPSDLNQRKSDILGSSSRDLRCSSNHSMRTKYTSEYVPENSIRNEWKPRTAPAPAATTPSPPLQGGQVNMNSSGNEQRRRKERRRNSMFGSTPTDLTNSTATASSFDWLPSHHRPKHGDADPSRLTTSDHRPTKNPRDFMKAEHSQGALSRSKNSLSGSNRSNLEYRDEEKSAASRESIDSSKRRTRRQRRGSVDTSTSYLSKSRGEENDLIEGSSNRSGRRGLTTQSSAKSTKSDMQAAKDDGSSSKPKQRRSYNDLDTKRSSRSSNHRNGRSNRNNNGRSRSGSFDSVDDKNAPCKNPHELVNSERTKRGLQPFSRNMLLDTMAKELANELCRTGGRLQSKSGYHGNIGQGHSIREIHQTMMKDRKGMARKNILSSRFVELGLGISKGQDGSLYMCQLFKV